MHALEAIDARLRDLDFVESGEALVHRAKAYTDAAADALFVADINHLRRAPA
jgi:2-methylisocitrate lyase-like PEP mutase family enzyme